MSYENKPKANWTLSGTTETHNIYVSDKGCVKMVPFTREGAEDGRYQNTIMLMPKAFEAVLNHIEQLSLLHASELYQGIKTAKQQSADQKYIARELSIAQVRAAKQLQAAKDALRLAGIDPATVFKTEVA